MTGLTPLIDILFVCTGNICRSPAAQLLAKNYLDNRFCLASAGTGTIDGERISANMAVLLSDRNIDSSEFRSTRINLDIINSSRLIMVMDRTHKRYINRITENAPVYFLADMIDGKFIERDIVDPFGLDMKYYEETFNIIDNSLKRFIENDLYDLI